MLKRHVTLIDLAESVQVGLGDLLLQAVFAAEITRQEGTFDIYDVITAIHDKLIRRHPHVFGDVEAKDAEAVLVNWEKLKNEERKAENKSVLDGVPPSLPALLKGSRLTEKAARVGFDWRRTSDVFDKLEEEIVELRSAIDGGNEGMIQEEIGDILFTVVNVARRHGVDPEAALQSTNTRFRRRIAGTGYPFDEEAHRSLVLEETRRAHGSSGFGRQIAAIAVTGDRRSRLASISAPTLIIHGTDDPLFLPECGKDTASSIPETEFMLINGMGHDLPSSLHRTVAEAIERTARRALKTCGA